MSFMSDTRGSFDRPDLPTAIANACLARRASGVQGDEVAEPRARAPWTPPSTVLESTAMSASARDNWTWNRVPGLGATTNALLADPARRRPNIARSAGRSSRASSQRVRSSSERRAGTPSSPGAASTVPPMMIFRRVSRRRSAWLARAMSRSRSAQAREAPVEDLDAFLDTFRHAHRSPLGCLFRQNPLGDFVLEPAHGVVRNPAMAREVAFAFEPPDGRAGQTSPGFHDRESDDPRRPVGGIGRSGRALTPQRRCVRWNPHT